MVQERSRVFPAIQGARCRMGGIWLKNNAQICLDFWS